MHELCATNNFAPTQGKLRIDLTTRFELVEGAAFPQALFFLGLKRHLLKSPVHYRTLIHFVKYRVVAFDDFNRNFQVK